MQKRWKTRVALFLICKYNVTLIADWAKQLIKFSEMDELHSLMFFLFLIPPDKLEDCEKKCVIALIDGFN